MFISAGVMAAMGLVPGMPTVPFLILGAGVGFIGVVLQKRGTAKTEEETKTKQQAEASLLSR